MATKEATSAKKKIPTVGDLYRKQIEEQIKGTKVQSCGPEALLDDKYKDAGPIARATIASVSRVVDVPASKRKQMH